MGVQGFPTLKIVKPSKRPGKPIVEDYQGPRESKGIVEQVKSAIPNNVKRMTDKALDDWFQNNNETAKAILFSNKGTTGALIKVVAAEFLGKISFAQIRDKEKTSVEMFGITEYPTLVVLPGGTKDPVVYGGAFSKTEMLDFASRFVTADAAGPDKKQKQKPVQKAEPSTSTEDAVKSEDAASSFSDASVSQESSQAKGEAAGATSETLEEGSNPTKSPEPAVTPEEKPIPIPNQSEPIPALLEEKFLHEKCLGERTSTCVLALLPVVEGEDVVLPESATTALASLAELAAKHVERGGKLFPFFSIPYRNTGATILRDSLKLGDDKTFELIAVNARRGWWRRFEGEEFDVLSVETWVDNIRFGEGKKDVLPEELLLDAKQDESTSTEAEKETATPAHGEL